VIRENKASEKILDAVSKLLTQCSRIGNNLNQIAHHLNAGGEYSTGIGQQLLTELTALANFRLDAEKVIGECCRTVSRVPGPERETPTVRKGRRPPLCRARSIQILPDPGSPSAVPAAPPTGAANQNRCHALGELWTGADPGHGNAEIQNLPLHPHPQALRGHVEPGS